MTIPPDNTVEIELTEGDMKKAVENYLNDHILKRPCTVIGLKNPSTVHGYKIRFEKAYEPDEQGA